MVVLPSGKSGHTYNNVKEHLADERLYEIEIY